MMSVVNRLTVKNFGPIKEVEVVFNRFTVFVGPQGVYSNMELMNEFRRRNNVRLCIVNEIVLK